MITGTAHLGQLLLYLPGAITVLVGVILAFRRWRRGARGFGLIFFGLLVLFASHTFNVGAVCVLTELAYRGAITPDSYAQYLSYDMICSTVMSTAGMVILLVGIFRKGDGSMDSTLARNRL